MSKIFVLGLSRTGTTSLHVALALMGFASVHYPAAAARRWLAGNFRAGLLADFDACLDLPTPLYYPQLDAVYPGSRFILLERDEDAWLDSVRRQWAAASPPGPRTQLRDVIRIAVYGVDRFNASRLRHVFRTHRRNVLEYFRGRRDLLVLDVTQGDPWAALCGFLERERPADCEAFPRLRSPYIGPLAAVRREELSEKRAKLLALVRGDLDLSVRQVPPPRTPPPA
ncbi:MAG: hypothetical protein KatS3mg124_0472 [Porticoccaceae bacterium]|nr:MAG: hypothetical protein KatS3mg124_0472 [Porticoccaceae bacterium]